MHSATITGKATWLVGLALVWAHASAMAWQDVDSDSFDQTLLSSRGRTVLAESRFSWRHAETEHFVLHFERKDFAQRVGRMAEFFYAYIAEDLKGLPDRTQGKSHIFIFRNSRQWDRFMELAGGGASEWAFSFVQGTSMYLQQAGSTSRSGDVLGHEMTHMVFNRFLPGRIPLWLNEGLAEWYEEFAYAALKGVKTSQLSAFRGFRDPIPLSTLFAMNTYPANVAEVGWFYRTSKFVVGYLLMEYSHDQMIAFLVDVAGGRPVEAALTQHYGFEHIEDMDQAFNRFLR